MSVATPSAVETPQHQRVSWLELFYDLVFVVVIEQLTHLLHDDPGWPRIWLTVGLTAVVWMVWFNVSALTNISGPIGPRGRPFVFCSMAGVGVMALGLQEMPTHHVALFVIGFVIARSAVWPLWMRSRRDDHPAWRRSLVYGPLLSLAWLAMAFVHSAVGLVVAFVVLGMGEMGFSLARSEGDGRPRIHGPHMVERIGLLLMIVLGESVVQIISALEGERTLMRWFTAALAMALLCSLWWIIYEATMSKLENVVERDDSNIADFVGGTQFGIITGLVMVAAGMADAIHSAGQGEHGASHLHAGSLTCLCVGVLVIHVGVTALGRRAFALDLGIGFSSRRPMTRAEKETARAEHRAQREREKAEGRQGESHWGEITHWITFVAPVLLVWFFGRSWAPWVVLLVLVAYVVANLWLGGVGERRIRDYVAAGGLLPGPASDDDARRPGEDSAAG